MNCARIAFVTLALGSTLVACNSELPKPSGPFTVSDSAGVQIVNNRTPEWTGGSQWHVDTVPITSIGGDDSDPNQQFRDVMGVRRLSDGRLVIASENELRLFDARGKFVKTIARRGSGPGEFSSMTGVELQHGDTILVLQSQAGGVPKVTTFNAQGELVREDRVDFDRLRKLGRWSECRSLLLADRTTMGCQHDASIPETELNRPSRVIKPGWTSPGAGHLRQLHRWYLIPPSLDSAYPIGIGAGIEQFGVKIGDNVQFISHPFYSYSLISSGGSPLRVAMMTNPEYNVEIWTPSGKLERLIRREGGRRAPTDEEKAEALGMMRTQAKNGYGDAAIVDRLIAAVPTPDSMPTAISLAVGDSGEILVQREGQMKSHPAAVFDVFNNTGRWLGEFRLPVRTYIRQVGSDYLLTIRLDENDVPHVEVLRLHREPKSPTPTQSKP